VRILKYMTSTTPFHNIYENMKVRSLVNVKYNKKKKFYQSFKHIIFQVSILWRKRITLEDFRITHQFVHAYSCAVWQAAIKLMVIP